MTRKRKLWLWLAAVVLLTPLAAPTLCAQNYPAQAVLGLVNSGSGWLPWTATLAGGTPPGYALSSVQLYCKSGSTIAPCNPSSGPGSTAWSALTNPTGNLSLTMGANNSAFTNTNNFSTPGTFTSAWQYAGNGINFASQWNTLYNGTPASYPSEELTAGIAVPSTSTLLQSDAIGAYASCAEAVGNYYCVALYSQAIRAAANSYTHAFNANVSDGNYPGGYQLFGGEVNSQVHNAGSGGASVLISANIDHANTPYNAIDINATGSNPYRTALNFLDGSATTGIAIGKNKAGTTSMPVTLASSAGTGNYLYDAAGNFDFSGPVIAPNTPLSPSTSGTITDSFARSAGSLGSNWAGGSTIQIVSSGVVGSTSGTGNDFAWYTGGGAFNTNQCSSITIQNVGTVATTWTGALVNTQDINNSYALLSFDETGTAQFQLTKIVAGSGNTLISQRAYSQGGNMAVGDVFKLCNNGSGVLTVYRNGIAEATTATDTTFSGGYPGIGFSANTTPRISSWTGTGQTTSGAVTIGGTFAAAGCTDFSTITVNNATSTMACVMTGQGGNPANVSPACAVTAANTVTPRLCSFTAQTVTSQNYSVRVIP
jgi:hypothetical protein